MSGNLREVTVSVHDDQEFEHKVSGLFHGWGTQDGTTVAIVEILDGYIKLVSVGNIEFNDASETRDSLTKLHNEKLLSKALTAKLEFAVSPEHKKLLLLWVTSEEHDFVLNFLKNFEFNLTVRINTFNKYTPKGIQSDILKS